MKKINSIGYGPLVLFWIFLFLIALPLSFYTLSALFHLTLLFIFIKVSLGIGMLLSIGFIGLLFIELHQDKRLDKYYSSNKNIKLKLGTNRYECPSCGNKKIMKQDTFCIVCGQKFKV